MEHQDKKEICKPEEGYDAYVCLFSALKKPCGIEAYHGV